MPEQYHGAALSHSYPTLPHSEPHRDISKLRLEDLLLTQAFLKQEMMSFPRASAHLWN